MICSQVKTVNNPSAASTVINASKFATLDVNKTCDRIGIHTAIDYYGPISGALLVTNAVMVFSTRGYPEPSRKNIFILDGNF